MRKKLSDYRQKMRKNKKGFTLVELIVVLVILAILIALLIPTLTGYIDKANKKKVQSEARQVLMAAQTLASEEYNDEGAATKNLCGKKNVALNVAPVGEGSDKTIEELAEVKGKYADSHVDFDDDGKVTSVVYNKKDEKFTATYSINSNGTGTWTVKKN